MTQTKIHDQSDQASISRFLFLILLTVLSVAGLGPLIGCHDSNAAHDVDPPPPAYHGNDQADVHPVMSKAPETQNPPAAEQEPEQEPGVLGKAGDLLMKATAKGGETAKGASQWVQDQLGSAADTGEQTAEETWEWANETFEMLKAKGLTTASDTSQWLGQDWNNIESWEYKVVTLGGTDEKLSKTLNQLGKKGWECIESETRTNGTTRYIFKKPTFSYLRQLPFKDVIKLVPLMNNNGEK